MASSEKGLMSPDILGLLAVAVGWPCDRIPSLFLASLSCSREQALSHPSLLSLTSSNVLHFLPQALFLYDFPPHPRGIFKTDRVPVWLSNFQDRRGEKCAENPLSCDKAIFLKCRDGTLAHMGVNGKRQHYSGSRMGPNPSNASNCLGDFPLLFIFSVTVSTPIR